MASRGRAGHRPGRRLRLDQFLALVLASLVTAAASGCATVPSGGAPEPLEGQSGQQQAFVQPLPPPGPQSNWSAKDVVLGFIQASANFKLDPAAAKSYLVPALRKRWRPTTAGTTVIDAATMKAKSFPPRLTDGRALEEVDVEGQPVASLSSTGQAEYQPGRATYAFELERNSQDIWQIQGLPTGDPLLLTQAAFDLVYEPQNLYYIGPLGKGDLVPDPVFVPVQGSASADTTTLARGLVQGLINGLNANGNYWLDGAVRTEFPPGTKLVGVSINNLTARVDLGVGAASLGIPDVQIAQMYAQLKQTLTTASTPDAPKIATSVQLAINGKVQRTLTINGMTASIDKSFALIDAAVPEVGYAKSPLYFASRGTVDTQAGDGRPTPLAGLQLPSQAGTTAVAASWGSKPELAVAMSDGSGCAIFIGPAVSNAPAYRQYSLPGSRGHCTSLSWDNGGDLWAVAGGRIWILRESASHGPPVGAPMPVTAPDNASVIALRMAADGTRAALLVHTKQGNRLLLAAAGFGPDSVTFGSAVPVGTDLTSPAALTWYKPYSLAVINQDELYEVPLTGGASQSLGPAPGDAASLTSNGSMMAVGTLSGGVYTSPGPDTQWTLVGPGAAPSYQS